MAEIKEVKEIVYREADQTIIIIPIPIEGKGDPEIRFLYDLSSDRQDAFAELKVFCLSVLPAESVLKYVIYKRDNGVLYVQPTSGKEVPEVVNDMAPADKTMIETVGLICTEILNE